MVIIEFVEPKTKMMRVMVLPTACAQLDPDGLVIWGDDGSRELLRREYAFEMSDN